MRQPSSLSRLAAFVVSVAAVMACAGGVDRVACVEPTVAITDSAITAYIDSVEPVARRFLISTGDYGDSALPEAAAAGLRAKGPAYLYPADTNVSRPVRQRLVGAGPYPALLVFYHGMQLHGDTAVDVTFSGRYVTGLYDNTVAPHKAIRMVCGPRGSWQIAKPAADTTGKAS